MELFELLNRGKVPKERAGVRGPADAGQIGRLIDGPGVGEGAGPSRGRGDIGKGVDEMRQFVRHAVLLEVGDVVSSVVNTPLFEVTSQNLVLFTGLRMRGACGCEDHQKSGQDW